MLDLGRAPKPAQLFAKGSIGPAELSRDEDVAEVVDLARARRRRPARTLRLREALAFEQLVSVPLSLSRSSAVTL